MATEARKKANKKYRDAHYDQTIVRLKKGDKARIKKIIEGTGISMNAFIKNCIEKELCLLESQ